jgi:hypothetical protein
MGECLLLRTACYRNHNAPELVLLKKEWNDIGRRGEIRMDTVKGKEISRHHAVIVRTPGLVGNVWVLRDQNSLNGTFVNSLRVANEILRNGDIITFGGGPDLVLQETVGRSSRHDCRYVFLLVPPKSEIAKEGKHFRGYENQDQCPVCKEDLENSETLPCRHSFCSDCLRQWIRACTDSDSIWTCPVCRAEFSRDEICKSGAVVFRNQIMLLKSQPFLDSLGIESVNDVVSFSVFRCWGKNAKQRFWEMFSRVKNSLIHKCVFLGLTHMTASDILAADEEALKIAAENLEINHDIQESNSEFLRNRVIYNMFMMTDFLRFKEPAFVLTKLI